MLDDRPNGLDAVCDTPDCNRPAWVVASPSDGSMVQLYCGKCDRDWHLYHRAQYRWGWVDDERAGPLSPPLRQIRKLRPDEFFVEVPEPAASSDVDDGAGANAGTGPMAPLRRILEYYRAFVLLREPSASRARAIDVAALRVLSPPARSRRPAHPSDILVHQMR